VDQRTFVAPGIHLEPTVMMSFPANSLTRGFWANCTVTIQFSDNQLLRGRYAPQKRAVRTDIGGLAGSLTKAEKFMANLSGLLMTKNPGIVWLKSS
jgi:hypothetical protein